MTKLNVIVPNVNMLNFDTVGEVKPHFIGSSTVLTLMDVATRQLPALMNAPSSSVGEDRAIVPYVPASQASDSGRRAKPSAAPRAARTGQRTEAPRLIHNSRSLDSGRLARSAPDNVGTGCRPT